MENKTIRTLTRTYTKGNYGRIIGYSIVVSILLGLVSSAIQFLIINLLGTGLSLAWILVITVIGLIVITLISGLVGVGFRWDYLRIARGEAFTLDTITAPFAERGVRNGFAYILQSLIVAIPSFVLALLADFSSLFRLVAAPDVLFSDPYLARQAVMEALNRSRLAFALAPLAAIVVVFLILSFVALPYLLRDRRDLSAFAIVGTAYQKMRGHRLQWFGLQLTYALTVLAYWVIVTFVLGALAAFAPETLQFAVGILGAIAVIAGIVISIRLVVRQAVASAVFYNEIIARPMQAMMAEEAPRS